MKNNHPTKYHRDGTITVWDVDQKYWQRRETRDVYDDDRVMASLPGIDRARIEARAHGMTLGQAQNLARQIQAAADCGGTLQSHQMVEIAGTADPTLHTTMSVECAARRLGCYYSLPA